MPDEPQLPPPPPPGGPLPGRRPRLPQVSQVSQFKVSAPSEPEWQPTNEQRAFLHAYAELTTVTQACQVVGVSPGRHAGWLRHDGYARRFAQAKEEAADFLEAEAVRRAHDGVDEPVFYKGVECGTVRKYSDTLLIFLLKSHRPERFRERMQVDYVSEDALDREIAQLGAEIERRRGASSGS